MQTGSRGPKEPQVDPGNVGTVPNFPALHGGNQQLSGYSHIKKAAELTLAEYACPRSRKSVLHCLGKLGLIH